MAIEYTVTAHHHGNTRKGSAYIYKTHSEDEALRQADAWENDDYYTDVTITEEAKNPKLTVMAYANESGLWRARVEFEHTLSANDTRPVFNIGYQWERIRRRARYAIVKEISEREQKTYETPADARRRVRASLPPLKVIDSDQNSVNTFHSFTFGE